MPKKPRQSSLQAKIEEAVGHKLHDEHEEDDSDIGGAVLDDEEYSDDDLYQKGTSSLHQKSKLRSKNAPSLDSIDTRYRGKRTSRKALAKDRGDEDDKKDLKEHASAELGHMFEIPDDEEDESESATENEDQEESAEDMEDEDRDESFDDMGDDISQFVTNEGSEEDESEINRRNEMVSLNKKSAEKEIQKGKAIRNQISLWENLLECRIQMQKVLTKVNRFPQHDQWESFMESGDDDYITNIQNCQFSLKTLLSETVELRDTLVSSNKELQKSIRLPKRSSDDESSSLSPTKKRSKVDLESLSDNLEQFHEAVQAFRNETIEKWNDKTRLVSTNTNKGFAAFETSTLRQIDHILSDKSRLIARTQVKRSDYEIIGRNPKAKKQEEDDGDTDETRDEEIFDDDDFYHHLLKELIERKTANITDPEQLSRHWLQVQKMRSKMKKKNVDTKASKGRKTRYDIHAKLVNFMAPIKYCSWKDEARNELFSSLFGKISGQ